MPETFEHMTQVHIGAGVRWIQKMSEPDKWNLSDPEAANLLGNINVSTYQEMKFNAANNIPIVMDPGSYECLSLLLNIWKCLRLSVPSTPEGLAYKWFSTPNSGELLMNKSIKDYLLARDGIEAFYKVRNYLCSRCC